MTDLDLNLLRVLDALMRHRGVTAAARELGLTQSSVSNALDRLRRALGDRVLERQGNAMVPTRRAIELWPRVAAGLDAIAGGLASLEAFDPATAALGFRIGMDDYALALAGPALCAGVAAAAPGVRLEILPARHPSDDNALRTGAMDAFVGAVWKATPGLASETLARETFVGLAARKHPLATGRVSLKAFLAHPHLMTSARGAVRGNVDAALAPLAERRRVAFTLPTFEATARAASAGLGVFCCGSALARRLAATHDLVAFRLPLAVPGFEVRQLWSSRNTPAPSHQWLRRLIAESVRTPFGSRPSI